MGAIQKKYVNSDFFKIWSSEMSYILGYIVADGCIVVDKKRIRNPFSLNITSKDKQHLLNIRKFFAPEHKVGEKSNGSKNSVCFQIQIRNSSIAEDLIHLGVLPKKTYHLGPIEVMNRYFSDFVRGFFDGDGSVYIYKVNGTPQIKSEFKSASLSFITELNKNICRNLRIPTKAIHIQEHAGKRIKMYGACFYVDDCEKLADFMYQNNPALCLARKQNIFERWKAIKRRQYSKQNYPSKVGWQLYSKVSK